MTIKEAIENSKSMAEAAKKLNMPFTTFKRKAGNLYKPNQGGKGIKNSNKGNKITKLEDILEGKVPTFATNKLKIKLLKAGMIKKECSWCGITDTWNDKPIVLHLDHINGIKNDHRLENLRLLCPNCHSQTDTYAGKGKTKRMWRNRNTRQV